MCSSSAQPVHSGCAVQYSPSNCKESCRKSCPGHQIQGPSFHIHTLRTRIYCCTSRSVFSNLLYVNACNLFWCDVCMHVCTPSFITVFRRPIISLWSDMYLMLKTLCFVLRPGECTSYEYRDRRSTCILYSPPITYVCHHLT